jgi:putative ABC transport system permease protein
MLAVTFADLWYRARQFLIAIVGVGLVLAVALAVTGLADGFYSEVQGYVDSVGADSWVMSNAAQGRVTAFAAFPESDAATVAKEPGVHQASPILFTASQVVLAGGTDAPQTVNLVGVQPGGLGSPRVVSGHGLTGPGQAVVDSKVTNMVGSTLLLAGKPYRIVGTVNGATMLGGTPLVYMPITDVQQAVTGGRPLATSIAVRGTPTNLPHGLVALAPSTVITDTMSQLKSAVASINSTRWLMWIIAAVIVAAMLYVAALERKRDFAVLKALGSSSRTLFLSLVLEAVVVTLLAAILAEALASLLTPTFAQPIDITPDARLVLPLVAIVVGIVASISALRRVTGADPAAAFG